MRKIPGLIILILIVLQSCDDTQQGIWKPASGPIMTQWSQDVDTAMPWPEYPRPQMVRDDWLNLNGLWDYCLLHKEDVPDTYSQKILVPYPVESALSGIADSVGPDHVIWYHRLFNIPSEWGGKNVLLHFEAVDWAAKVIVNGETVGEHKGGYDPFSFDITAYLKPGGTNELIVCASDPTSEGYQPRGKQVLKPGGIWYTPSSGIWQTVWLEAVPEVRVDSLYITPRPGEHRLDLRIMALNTQGSDIIRIQLFEADNEVMNREFPVGEEIRIDMPEFKWWTPETPFLYDLHIGIIREGIELDRLRSYFGMREVSCRMADDGYVRLFLNGEVVFHNGPLDQGFWPDGLYTPPTDEAMRSDIAAIKKMGFNMLRKHVKVENRRFYYWCDKLGVMVWQDMPSTSGYVAPDKADLDRPQQETGQFLVELGNMIKSKYNHPSIVMWVPFNEGWGQFSTAEVVDFIYRLDPGRLVNNTSGWADRGVGNVIDIHHYPDPRTPDPENGRASVLGEFGGLGLFIEGHTWEQNNWGYRQMDDASDLLLKYEQFYTTVWEMMSEKGLAAAVYTQTTDVETETNGLLTYDRAVSKMDVAVLNGINTNNYVPAPRFEGEEKEEAFNKSLLVRLVKQPGSVYYTLDGSEPDTTSYVYTEPFSISNTTTVKAVCFREGRKSLVNVKQFTRIEKIPPVYHAPFDKRYPGSGHFTLVDGQYGSLDHSDGHWQGFRNNGLDITVDLGTMMKISSVGGNFLVKHEGWIFSPKSFMVLTSSDGKEFQAAGELHFEIPREQGEPKTERIQLDGLDARARYVRIKAETIGASPDWLTAAKGRPAWIFIDEIIIE